VFANGPIPDNKLTKQCRKKGGLKGKIEFVNKKKKRAVVNGSQNAKRNGGGRRGGKNDLDAQSQITTNFPAEILRGRTSTDNLLVKNKSADKNVKDPSKRLRPKGRGNAVLLNTAIVLAGNTKGRKTKRGPFNRGRGQGKTMIMGKIKENPSCQRRERGKQRSVINNGGDASNGAAKNIGNSGGEETMINLIERMPKAGTTRSEKGGGYRQTLLV